MNPSNPPTGGLVLPDHVARQRAKEAASAYQQVILSYCPKVGAYVVPEGTSCMNRQFAGNPPMMTHWVLCPACSTEDEPVWHMANMVLVEAAAEAEKEPDNAGD